MGQVDLLSSGAGLDMAAPAQKGFLALGVAILVVGVVLATRRRRWLKNLGLVLLLGGGGLGVLGGLVLPGQLTAFEARAERNPSYARASRSERAALSSEVAALRSIGPALTWTGVGLLLVGATVGYARWDRERMQRRSGMHTDEL